MKFENTHPRLNAIRVRRFLKKLSALKINQWEVNFGSIDSGYVFSYGYQQLDKPIGKNDENVVINISRRSVRVGAITMCACVELYDDLVRRHKRAERRYVLRNNRRVEKLKQEALGAIG